MLSPHHMLDGECYIHNNSGTEDGKFYFRTHYIYIYIYTVKYIVYIVYMG